MIEGREHAGVHAVEILHGLRRGGPGDRIGGRRIGGMNVQQRLLLVNVSAAMAYRFRLAEINGRQNP